MGGGIQEAITEKGSKETEESRKKGREKERTSKVGKDKKAEKKEELRHMMYT